MLGSVVNRAFRAIGYEIDIKKYKPIIKKEVLERFRRQLEQAKEECADYEIIEELRDESMAHPMHYIDYECEFGTEQIRKYGPNNILDIGSYRHWLIGIMAHYPVTTMDVRKRTSYLKNESIITEDITNLRLPNDSVEMVTTMHTIEHFGLGRYGDKFDLQADAKAVAQVIRTLKPGGLFMFSVPVTKGRPCLAFNSHRIYNMQMVRKWVEALGCIDERFIKRKPARICEENELADKLGEFDVYCGCYKKGMD